MRLEGLSEHRLYGIRCSEPWSCLSEQLLGSCCSHSPLCVFLTFVRRGLCFGDGSLVPPFVPVTNVLLFVLSLPLPFLEVARWYLTFKSNSFSFSWRPLVRSPKINCSASGGFSSNLEMSSLSRLNFVHFSNHFNRSYSIGT